MQPYTIGPFQSFSIMAGCYEAVGHVPILRLAIGTAGIEPDRSCEVLGGLVQPPFVPCDDTKTEVTPELFG